MKPGVSLEDRVVVLVRMVMGVGLAVGGRCVGLLVVVDAVKK